MKVLLEKIAEESMVCQHLLITIARERAVLTAGQLNDLVQVVEEKERLINRVEQLEGECRRLVANWARPSGLAPGTSSVDRPVRMGDDNSAELAKVTHSLAELARQVADGNRANAILLEHSLRTTRELLHGIASLGRGDGTYSMAGQPKSSVTIATALLNRHA